MKNNKGFATSFILFSILVLFLILLSVLLFTMNNSTTLNGKLKNDLVNKIENSDAYRQYNYASTGFVQEFTAPKTRTYTIKAWSANDGEGKYIYTSANINLVKGEKLYLYVGKSDFNDGKTEIRTVYGEVGDTSSISSRILYAAHSTGESFITNKFDLVNSSSYILKSDDPNMTASQTKPDTVESDTGYIRIYYTIKADSLEYNDKKYNTGCNQVQCVLDKVKQMISSN